MRTVILTCITVLMLSCGGSDRPPVPPSRPGTSVEIADFEIHSDGIDRFTSCPPPGELGQEWLPPLPDWTPPPASSQDAPPPDQPAIAAGGLGRSNTEQAADRTRAAFRSCYHRGLIHAPGQFGHVAIVARVGPDGRVAKVESYGACGVSHEVLACMHDEAKQLRFAPPPGGKDTVVIPASFVPRSGPDFDPDRGDAYTASAYVALEALRPEFHQCLDEARRFNKPVEAWGMFDMKLDAHGNVTDSHVDPWGGDQDLLRCAATVMQKLSLPPPVGGRGSVLARITFNPRGNN